MPTSPSLLPKLVTPKDQPALRTDPGARGYVLLGFEPTVRPEVSSKRITVVAFGSETQDAAESIPSSDQGARTLVSHG
jgi:hypothetical protein